VSTPPVVENFAALRRWTTVLQSSIDAGDFARGTPDPVEGSSLVLENKPYLLFVHGPDFYTVGFPPKDPYDFGTNTPIHNFLCVEEGHHALLGLRQPAYSHGWSTQDTSRLRTLPVTEYIIYPHNVFDFPNPKNLLLGKGKRRIEL